MTTSIHPNRNRWLIAIGALKLFKAALFVSIGFGIRNLVHKDVADLLWRAVLELRIDPENRIVNLVLERAELLKSGQLAQISWAIFSYAALDVIEGIGLVREKPWAEYFTLILTASFLPWEIYVLERHPTPFRGLLILINAAVVIYLAIVVKDRVRERRIHSTATTPK